MIELNKCYYFQEKDINVCIIEINYESSIVYFIEMGVIYAIPDSLEIEEWEDLARRKEIMEVKNPFDFFIDPDFITEKQNEKANKNYSWISNYWEDSEVREKLLRHKHGEGIYKRIAEEQNISINNVRILFVRFWQRGMTRNSLLTNYSNCGAKGETRIQIIKVGAKKKVKLNGEIVAEHLLTPQDKIYFSLAYNIIYKNKSCKSYRRTYEEMLSKYYSECTINDGEQGGETYDLSLIPSYDQFYNWICNNRDAYKDRVKRRKLGAYNLTERPRLSTAAKNVVGPGSQYELDATLGNTELVSTLDAKQSVGKPTLYIAIDTFSALIVGFYACLEPENWIGYAMLLSNVITNKPKFVENLGLDCISEYAWPSQHMAKTLLSDNGPFVSQMADSLANYHGISLRNTASYRGDAKGTVEQIFCTLKKELRLLPGGVQDDNDDRGTDNAKKNAKLNIVEFVKIVTTLILTYNNNTIKGRHVTADMVTDGVKTKPTEMWEWGVQKYGLPIKYHSEEVFSISMLPEIPNCKITRDGIKLNGATYVCDKFIEGHWELSRINEFVKIKYDPRRLNDAYLLEKGEPIIRCRLTDKWSEFAELTVAEFKIIKSEIGVVKRVEENRNTLNRNNARTKIKSICDNKVASGDKIKTTGEKEARKLEAKMQNGCEIPSNRAENSKNQGDLRKQRERLDQIAKLDDTFD